MCPDELFIGAWWAAELESGLLRTEHAVRADRETDDVNSRRDSCHHGPGQEKNVYTVGIGLIVPTRDTHVQDVRSGRKYDQCGEEADQLHHPITPPVVGVLDILSKDVCASHRCRQNDRRGDDDPQVVIDESEHGTIPP